MSGVSLINKSFNVGTKNDSIKRIANHLTLNKKNSYLMNVERIMM
jgi:hypothetical protein